MEDTMKIKLDLCLLLLPLLLLAEDRVHASCTDYSTGMLSAFAAENPWTVYSDLLSLHSDAVLRWQGGQLCVIHRMGADNIQVIDPDNGYETLSQFSVGTASNPQDLVVYGEKAWVSRNDENLLLQVDWPEGTVCGGIDLSAWADADGLAELGCMARVGDRLFVSIQRLDRDYWWLPVGDSYLAVVDLPSESLLDVDPVQEGVQAVRLPLSNPVGEIQVFQGQLYLSCPSSYGLLDGGLLRVDPETFECTILASEEELNGDLGDLAIENESLAYAIVGDASFNTHLYRLDLGASTAPELFVAGAGWVFTDLEIHEDQLYATDQSWGASGVRIYDSVNGDLLRDTFSLGLPPYDLLAPESGDTGSGEAPETGGKLSAWPNPFNPQVRISWDGMPEGPARLEVFDSSGRRVASLLEGFQEGRGSVDWRSEDLPAGVYLARLASGGKQQSMKLVLVK
jgi:hypothetical protein